MPTVISAICLLLVAGTAVTAGILSGGPFQPEEVRKRAETNLVLRAEILRRTELDLPKPLPCGPSAQESCWQALGFAPEPYAFQVEVTGKHFWIQAEALDVPGKPLRVLASHDIPATRVQ